MGELCGCSRLCGDDGDTEGPGVCKGLPDPPRPPLVEFFVVHRDDYERVMGPRANERTDDG